MRDFDQQPAQKETSIAADLSVGLLGILWQAIRLPVYGALVLVEPVVRFVLFALGLLSVVTAFLFEYAIHAPNFPFWGMLGFGLACGAALALYEGLIRVFSR